jgi:hypothetical protein
VRSEDRVDLFSKPAEVVDAAPGLAGGKQPRGLTSGGWVRTTGWLQIGEHVVSSVHVATVVGLLCAPAAAVALARTTPVVAGILVIAIPALSGVLWWCLTVWVRPASRARNIGTKQAGELSPGDLIRLYGSIGPVGQVTEVSPEEDVRVTLHGGGQESFASGQAVHVVELLS